MFTPDQKQPLSTQEHTKKAETLFPNEEEETSLFPTSPQEQKRYTLLKELGEGGMGVVQLVRDELLGREVALKKIQLRKTSTPQKAKRLLWRLRREAEIMATLEHPNIVPLYEIQIKSEGELQFTMKKVEGQTLRHILIQEDHPYHEERQLLGIFLKICDGVRYAHSKGVIHRDLKPENIMVGQFGEVYILDWGIAKKREEIEEEISEQTQTTTSKEDIHRTHGGIGTLGYMSPEQQISAQDVSEKADIYALGKILRECYTYLSPWQEMKEFQNYLAEVQKKHTLKSIYSFESRDKPIPQEIRAIVKKATEKEPQLRYHTVQDFAKDVESYLKDVPVSAKEYRLDELLQKWIKRHYKIVTFISVFVGIALLFWGYLQWKTEQQYQILFAEAQQKKKYVASVRDIGRSGREKRIHYLLESITDLNEALRYRPGRLESEVAKWEAVQTILPLCYEEEDYQLATFVTQDLKGISFVPESEKQKLITEVQQKKNETFTQHLARLNQWERRYKSTDTLEMIRSEETDDFIFEIAQMKEEEIFNRLLALVQEGYTWIKQPILQRENARLADFYRYVVIILGRMGNTKATESFRAILLESSQFIFKNKETFKDLAYIEFIGEIATSLCHLKDEHSAYLIQNIRDTKEFSLLRKKLEKPFKKIRHHLLESEPQNEKMFRSRALARKEIGDIEGALQDINNAILLAPNDTYLYLNRGSIRESANDWEGAIEDFNKVIQTQPQNSSAYMSRGNVKKTRKDLQGAFLDLSQAIRLDPQNEEIYYNRALVRKAQGDIEGAIQDYTETIHLNFQFADAYQNRGNIFYDREEFQKAIEDYTTAIRLHPQFTEAYSNRGNAKKKQGDFEGALEDYSLAIRYNPQDAISYNNRATLKHYQKDFDGAIQDYNLAIRLEPTDPLLYNNRGKANESKGNLIEALKDYNLAIQVNPKFSIGYQHRGNLKRKSGDLEGAIQDYNSAIALDPKNIDAYNHRGNAKAEQKDFEGAIQDYTEIIQIFPQDPLAYYNRANAKVNAGNLEGAIQDYTENIRLHPESLEAYFNRGTAKQGQGDFDGALQDYERAIQINPQFFQAYHHRGNIRLAKRDLAGAIQDYDQVIRLSPQSFMAYYNRGNAKYEYRDFEGALADYTESIRLNPEFEEPYSNRGNLRREKKDFEGAIQDFNRAIQIKPHQAESYNNRGIVKQEQGDFDSAIQDYLEAIRLNPQFEFSYYNLGRAYQLKGNLKEAVHYWEKGLQLRMNPHILKELTNILLLQIKQQLSQKDYSEALQNLYRLKQNLPAHDPRLKRIDQEILKVKELLSSEKK